MSLKRVGDRHSTWRVDALDQARAEVGKFPLAHPADVAERFQSCWPHACEFAQGRVVKDHVGGHATLGGDLTAQIAQLFEERLVDIAPRSLFDSRTSCAALLCLDQTDGAPAAHHFP